jgi:hypothetical protein
MTEAAILMVLSEPSWASECGHLNWPLCDDQIWPHLELIGQGQVHLQTAGVCGPGIL